jgi:hypothetical protein
VAGRRLDGCLDAVGGSQFDARVVEVKIDRPLGEPQDLRNLGRCLAARRPGERLNFAVIEIDELRPLFVRATPAKRALMIVSSTSKSIGLVT